MPSIYGTLLGRGYFPKELPPAFFTEDFSRYATSRLGRAAVASYKPPNGMTELVRYSLALPGQGGVGTRPLSIPHPWAFASLAGLVAKRFRRLLKKSGASRFSKSRPVYGAHQARAIRPLVRPPNLARERANSRAGATHLLKVDVSQFYPALYTHAVGWAIDPKLREKKNWQNMRLLGRQIDMQLMRMQGRISQGIPVGNDLSFLLSEIVLAQVDKGLRVPSHRAYRWFDDYEIACDSRRQAEEVLVTLTKLLDSFRLRTNPKKTRIVELPEPAGDGWQDELRALSDRALRSTGNMVSYFDHAFRARLVHPEQSVLLYAVGSLFKVTAPRPAIATVAQSCMMQALLSEPGSAQKVFALLTLWEMSGTPFDRTVVASTIDALVRLHESRGMSSDVSWALAFCIQHRVTLSRQSGQTLTLVKDDAVAIQSLHAHSMGLLPGFSKRELKSTLQQEGCDGEHWLVLYTAVRQGFLPSLRPVVSKDPLFADFLAKKVSFYRQALPSYSLLVHPGGAPGWVVSNWLKAATGEPAESVDHPVVNMIANDVRDLGPEDKSVSDIVRELLDHLIVHETDSLEPYQ